MIAQTEPWPSLPLDAWKDTYATLHLWTQIVGKIRLAQTPWINHSWHVTLYVTSRGLTTSPIPCGSKTFQIDFDFIDQRLSMQASDGGSRHMELKPRPVADFYSVLFKNLRELGIETAITTTPCEVPNAIAFDQDREHASYDADYAHRWWLIVAHCARVFQKFRAGFTGKCSPVHFFWGSFDLAVTRFSGRTAPAHPGGFPNLPDWVAREAYSHELSSCGFWPGGDPAPFPLFYAYAYPQPDGFASAPVRPGEASYHTVLREFVLPYEAVRASKSPDAVLLDFLQSTHESAANLGGWDRAALERRAPFSAS